MHEYARVCAGMRKYARVCLCASVREYVRVCAGMRECARVCRSICAAMCKYTRACTVAGKCDCWWGLALYITYSQHHVIYEKKNYYILYNAYYALYIRFYTVHVTYNSEPFIVYRIGCTFYSNEYRGLCYTGMRGYEYAQVCASMRGHARVCTGMRKYMRGYRRLYASVHCGGKMRLLVGGWGPPGLREYARVCTSTHVYARSCASMRGYARVCASVREYVRVCAGMRECARVCRSICAAMCKYTRACTVAGKCDCWWGLALYITYAQHHVIYEKKNYYILYNAYYALYIRFYTVHVTYW